MGTSGPEVEELGNNAEEVVVADEGAVEVASEESAEEVAVGEDVGIGSDVVAQDGHEYETGI